MFETVLFDIDGVMLSEERYFDASALTVHELLTSNRFMGLQSVSPVFGTDPTDEVIHQIRRDVFQNDGVLERLKNVGVNANWDMVYLVFVSELAAVLRRLEESSRTSEQVQDAISHGWTATALQRIGEIARTYFGGSEYRVEWGTYDAIYRNATSKQDLFEAAKAVLPPSDDHELWLLCQSTFQEWYLGDAYSGKQAGKKGFLTNEIPIVEAEALGGLLRHLKESGVHLGVATGRPQTETEVPLQHFGWWSYFDTANVSTATNVMEAEARVPSARPLSKPNPYSYLRSLTGLDDPEELLATRVPLEGYRQKVLIVGDSIADALAAQRLGVSFAAVLTGLEGKEARSKFEKLNVDYIFDTVLDVNTLF
ncbi:HAD family hydrolase [Alicyclobacillus dauci]|uniref:HAD hydrolase-like protein n=1 Tax=Alicyclobacillus dauci TaxID=1475485 RepID=A0ABY6Z0Q6_9BACL|nr:HAD hydrolase-like protein [Alicyclobacillus dauci]WAH35555.1 HAD hydrolase-like protein [Alicyclobacillus dauci]